MRFLCSPMYSTDPQLSKPAKLSFESYDLDRRFLQGNIGSSLFQSGERYIKVPLFWEMRQMQVFMRCDILLRVTSAVIPLQILRWMLSTAFPSCLRVLHGTIAGKPHEPADRAVVIEREFRLAASRRSSEIMPLSRFSRFV